MLAFFLKFSTDIHSGAQVISSRLLPYQTTGLLVSVYAEYTYAITWDIKQLTSTVHDVHSMGL